MTTRRDLLKTLTAVAGAAAVSPASLAAVGKATLSLSPESGRPFAPLQTIMVSGASSGTLVVTDGDGTEYLRAPAKEPFKFRAGGALGRHTILLLDADERLLASTHFQLDCRTEINDDGGRFAKLMDHLRWTMETWERDSPVFAARFNDRIYHYFVSWLRDNTHSMKGMKYYWGGLTEAVDLYADTQRSDGMIFDNVSRRTPEMSFWDWVLKDGNFILVSRDRRWEMKRQPVEADVEYLFIEAVYYTWKATGDDAWMASRLENAIRAVHYSTHDPYRWSSKYKLVKRGYTIDTWDFVPQSDQIKGQNQLVDLEHTPYGIMFGDNTGLIAGCTYLAEMLEYLGRKEQAAEHRQLAVELQQRLDSVAWNGHFYRHHVAEDSALVRDLGVDEATQVSLSNAYSINRGITHEQAVAILRTYQKIRRTMPSSSPGEFYAIYPPFHKGFEGDNSMWEYMNGGVLSLVAGELAHGAFEHGFEDYGVDILLRQKAIAEKHDGYLPVTLRGSAVEQPKRGFETLNIASLANVDTGAGGNGVIGWLNEPGNDLAAMPTGRQSFEGVPFEIPEGSKNAGRVCIGLSFDKGYSRKAALPAGKKAASLYLLHTRARQAAAGLLRFHYVGGETHTEFIDANAVGSWWAPEDTPRARVAWRGANAKFGNLGVYVTGFQNPHPEWAIESLEFEAMDGAKWIVLGATLSDSPVYFAPKNDVSFGIPDIWGAAAVVYALVEGLAGVKDSGVTFDPATVTPRWTAAGVASAEVSIRYAASRGYVRYNFRYDARQKSLQIDVTGNARRTTLSLLMPAGLSAHKVTVDGTAREGKLVAIENSRYLQLEIKGKGVHTVTAELS